MTAVEEALMAFIGTTSLCMSFCFNTFSDFPELPWLNGRFSGTLALAAALLAVPGCGTIFLEEAEIGEREIEGIVFERLLPTD